MPRITLYCAEQAHIGALHTEMLYFQSRAARDKYVKSHDLSSWSPNITIRGCLCNGYVYCCRDREYVKFYTNDETHDNARRDALQQLIDDYSGGYNFKVDDYDTHIKISTPGAYPMRIFNAIDLSAAEIFGIWTSKWERDTNAKILY